MSPAARSIFVFAVYLWTIGAVLVLVPNALLSLLGMPETDEVWVRVVGMLVLILGYYYMGAARQVEVNPVSIASQPPSLRKDRCHCQFERGIGFPAP